MNIKSSVIIGLASLAFLSAGCSQDNTPVDKPLSKEEGVIQTNVNKIKKEIESNSKETMEQTYNKKKVQVVGQIQKRWVMNDGSLCVCIGMQDNLLSKEKYHAIRVIFNVSQREAVNRLKDGDFVVVKGEANIYEPDENKGKSLFFDIYNAKIE